MFVSIVDQVLTVRSISSIENKCQLRLPPFDGKKIVLLGNVPKKSHQAESF